MNQYPDSITITIRPEPVQNPVTGIYTAASGGDTAYTFNCRAEINNAGGKIAGRDGAVYDYSYTVYMPRTATLLPAGSDYSLTLGGMTLTGKILGSSNGQLNSRIWL